MRQRPEPPAEVVARLRDICLALPDAYEEQAWIGVRWRIRHETFAHVLMVADGWPPAYARAAGESGPMCVLTFRSSVAGLDPRHYAEAPFFRPTWRPDIVGMRLDEPTDWDAVADLVAGSYRLLAPLTLGGRADPSA
jgi:hypothetical protein